MTRKENIIRSTHTMIKEKTMDLKTLTFGDKVIVNAGMLFIMILVLITAMIVGIGVAEWNFAFSAEIVMKFIGKLFSICFGFCS